MPHLFLRLLCTGASMSNSTDSRLLSFTLYRCTDLPAACTAAQQIIVDYATGDASISQVDLDGARCDLRFGIGREALCASCSQAYPNEALRNAFDLSHDCRWGTRPISSILCAMQERV